jgi:hypothetical protein
MVARFSSAVLDRLDAISRQFKFTTLQIDQFPKPMVSAIPSLAGEFIAQETAPSGAWRTVARLQFTFRDASSTSYVTFIKLNTSAPTTHIFTPWEDDKVNAVFDEWRDILRRAREQIDAEERERRPGACAAMKRRKQ